MHFATREYTIQEAFVASLVCQFVYAVISILGRLSNK